eukprot:1409448-Amphidinium_carterae.1
MPYQSCLVMSEVKPDDPKGECVVSYDAFDATKFISLATLLGVVDGFIPNEAGIVQPPQAHSRLSVKKNSNSTPREYPCRCKVQ